VPRLLLALTAVGLLVALSGCITIKHQSATQRTAGVVTLAVEMCATDNDRSLSDDCVSKGPDRNTEEGSSAGDAQFGGLGQILLGYRVPAGTGAPASFPSTNAEVLFTRNDEYASELERVHPAGTGMRWFGYLSTPKLFSIDNPNGLGAKVVPEFTLPRQAGGAPLAGAFLWRAVTGFRPIDDDKDASLPVTCGTSCFDSPRADQFDVNLPAPVSDFGVLDPPAASAGQGASATVSFPVRYVDGRKLGPLALAFKASTDVPGAVAAPSVAMLTVAPGAQPAVTVTVPIPPGTPLGTYHATLSAATGTPAVTRSSTATIRVVDVLAPSVRIGAPADGAAFRRGDAIAADYACTDEANGSGVTACSGPVAPGAPVDTRTVGTHRFEVAATDAAGNAATRAATYNVLPKAPPNVKLAFGFARRGRTTTFTALTVKGVPAGSTVTATCRPRGRCAGRRFVRRAAPRKLALRPLIGKRFEAGAALDIRVTHPGSAGAVKLLRVRAGAPAIATRCVLPGERELRRRC
jgi:hypothetical protein